MGQPGFWDHQETAKPVVMEVKTLKAMIDPVEAILRDIEDVKALYDNSLLKAIEAELDRDKRR